MQAEITYNWDDIEVGRFDLNHSENFFTQKHLKHEKFSEEFKLIREMAEANLKEAFANDIAIESREDKENAVPGSIKQIKKENDSPLSIAKDTEVVKSETLQVQASKSTPLSAADNHRSAATQLAAKHSVPRKTEAPQTNASKSTPLLAANRRPANLLTRLKTPQPPVQSKQNGGSSAAVKNGKADPPHAYEFMDIYQKKREEKIRKLLEEEKKNRVFHSRPAPKSVITPREPLPAHKALIGCKVTAPITPLVLKNSRQADERRKQRLEEWKARNPANKFTSREAAVLHTDPFVPKKSGQHIQVQPFNLHVERRLEERKHYDEQLKRTAEEKKKQEEEERKKHEDELVKELRKLASFKARPNPFK